MNFKKFVLQTVHVIISMTYLNLKILILIIFFWNKNHTKYFYLSYFVWNFGIKPLLIKFNKIDGFLRVYDGTRYLVLFGPEKYDTVYNKIRYLIS